MKNLRAIREAKGLTQRQCFEVIGVEEQTWRRWEQGKHEPSIAVQCKIADFLGVTLDQLAGREAFPLAS